MGLLDSLLGRNKKVAPNLDALFGVPSAAISIEAGETLAIVAMMTASTLGGMIGSRQAPAMIVPADRRRSYPR